MYTISQLIEQTGITSRTIRYYEELGLLILEKQNGKRILNDENLLQLIKIFLMKITNKKLKDIKDIDLEKLQLTLLNQEINLLCQQLIGLSLTLEGLLEETNVEREFQLLKELNNYININVNLN
ncbi:MULTISPECIES: MerR family transcriptional regulator [Bacillus]|uniref:Transcriptional regulator, MerR family n=1 Tax=Bacillus cereus (strain ATCC 14579 / DSM 31 / CCUG 7414 / JCM 2152 / NBRC 15305 / NCIMB 9373 / NCTC 2599 / NRRL B-3711) TaxID=226900 RepID=Q815Q9_BACCR|nr:MerR family transcriptional regulator [Bacillus cereus]AAP11943.1 Transcriptional regulator, MerR family [Bacillus cereus ATCC 14579]EEL09147.1 Transcriptional regulator, MerR [Bacillus cereus BDRD-Cer4]ETT71473.1 MerR family transcriptional regulator [Bacillus cereus]KZD84106.1 Transcriptional regulator MerR family [Bacillus cereus]MCC3288250.1 MerR family transcriptional regulator [Bacillus cereus]